MTEPALARIRVGISSCLLGEEVRFDGGHKRSLFITESLARYFEFVPRCPEVAIGLGIPRQAIRLVGDPEAPRAKGNRDDSLDATDALRDYGRAQVRALTDISGYILKRASPSCGMERVKVYSQSGMPAKTGTGIYAREFSQGLPLLPMEEEGRLQDPALRENFIGRVFLYHRWQALERAGVTAGALVAFHTEHKLLIGAHDENEARACGRLLAGLGDADVTAVAKEYINRVMTAVRKPITRRQHARVLQRLAGFLKRSLDSGDRQELAETIENYGRGLVPLIVPLTLLRHHFRRNPDEYIARQLYMSPYPEELMLRNSV